MTDNDLRLLIERNYSGVMRVCRSWLHSMADAEDAAQEVFARYLEFPRTFGSSTHERAWFIRCAKNQAADHLRRRKREERRMLPLEEGMEIPDSAAFPETDVLDGLMDTLPPYTQAVLRLHYGEGYGYRELAGMLGTTEGRLKMLVSRAKTKLQKQLQEREDENG